MFTSEKEAAKAVGASVAKQLAEQVDFSMEKVALVCWSTGGPPFATLKHEVKNGENDYEVRFFTKDTAKPGQRRGLALRRGTNYFAVPQSVTVKAGAD